MGQITRQCELCGTSFVTEERYVLRGHGRFCSLACAGKTNLRSLHGEGAENPNWRGGMTTSSKGYVYIHRPDHPRASKTGYVKRADLVLEEKLGRSLETGEFAHHENGIKGDDDPANLTVVRVAEHNQKHGAKRRVPLVLLRCGCCGAEVYRPRWRLPKVEGSFRVFCSSRCSTKFWRAQQVALSRSVVVSSSVIVI